MKTNQKPYKTIKLPWTIIDTYINEKSWEKKHIEKHRQWWLSPNNRVSCDGKIFLETSVSHHLKKKTIAIASVKKFNHRSVLMLMQWGHTWVEEAMVSNRYLWSSWNGCYYDYYDWVIEAFSVKVNGQQWIFWTMPTSHMVQRFHWLSGRTWTIWQGNSRHPEVVFVWIVKKRLMWLLQYDINQICPDFDFRLIIICH